MGVASASLSLCVFALICTVSVIAVDNVFISIDCGSTSPETYRDEILIPWSGDTDMNNGESQTVPAGNSKSLVMDTLRVFTGRKKNCYRIDDVRRGRVLIRASFYYGNYDQKSSPPSFDLQFDGNHWATVTTSATQIVEHEVIYVMKKNNISVCVAQTKENQFPFISALEIRALDSWMYNYINNTNPLFLVSRNAYGANATIRFPNDLYDRKWSPVRAGNGLTELHTNRVINNNGVWNDFPSPAVLQNAITPIDPNSSLTLSLGLPPGKIPVYMFWYFCEITQLQPNQNRSFRVLMDDTLMVRPFSPPYLNLTGWYLSNYVIDGNTTLSFVPENYSTLPPLINAFEVFTVGDFLTNGTNPDDLGGLASLQKSFEVLQEWKGDPCLPLNFSWDWINCSRDPQPRVTALFLGSFGLSGSIPDFSSMKQLQIINLRNNSLTGPIPDFFGTFPNLQELNLQENKLNGSVPSSLSQKKGLNLVLNDNPDLCTDNSCVRNNGRQKQYKLPSLIVITILSFIINRVA